MKFSSRTIISFALVFAAMAVVPSIARAQLGAAPTGYIWDVWSVNPGTLPNYTQFSTSFIADNASEYVSFAFRESPAYFAFDDALVYLSTDGSHTNLLPLD